MSNPRFVFDSEAILAFYLGEEGGEVVKDHLNMIQSGEADGFLNVVNLAEVYYVLHRASPRIAEEKEQKLRLYGLRIVPVDDGELWRAAAKIKAKHALSLADAFAVATGKIHKGRLIVGSDEDFKGVDVELGPIRKRK